MINTEVFTQSLAGADAASARFHVRCSHAAPLSSRPLGGNASPRELDVPRVSQEEKTRTGMAGEFLVAAELNRRGFQAAVTFGSAKRADVYALDSESDRLARIEVKSTPERSRKWVLGQRVLDRKAWTENVFWVLVKLPDPHPPTADTTDEIRGRHAPRFYIFTSKEIGEHVQGLHEE